MSGLGLLFMRRGIQAHPSQGSGYLKLDPAVEEVLVAHGVSADGIGITPEDAARCTNISTWFKGNTEIRQFDDLDLFGVTELAANAFDGCTSLESINLVKMKKINNFAFRGCTSLYFDYLDMPELTSFGGEVFRGVHVRHINLGKIASLPYAQGQQNYGLPDYLEGVTIPEGVPSIPKYSFYNCTALRHINIPQSVTGIGEYAFYNAPIETEVILPKLTSMNYLSFSYSKITKFHATALTSLPSQMNNIGVFEGCTQLSDIDLPNVKTVPNYTFKNCGFHGAVTLYFENFNDQSFYNNAIEELYLPNVITLNGATYQQGVFAKNTLLRKVDIGANCTKINRADFALCSALETFICRAATPPSLHSESFISTNTTFIIYVPDESVDAYKAASNWSKLATRIKGISEYNG